MKVRVVLASAVSFGLLMAGVSVHGHHSFDAEYDRNQPLTVTGVVVEVQWTNPHARIYVDGPDPDAAGGEIIHWDFELGPPNGLMRRGWRRDSLPPGTMVTVEGFRTREPSNVANARSVTLGDGRRVFAGSSFEVEPEQ